MTPELQTATVFRNKLGDGRYFIRAGNFEAEPQLEIVGEYETTLLQIGQIEQIAKTGRGKPIAVIRAEIAELLA